MEIDPLEIPKFLRISAEERKAAWAGRKLTDQHTGVVDDDYRIREEERRRALAKEKREKNAAALIRLKAQHVGEKYDRKLKIWVPL